ncbi:hypothetical protein CEE69_15175 [Rhodopirellula bahusiensis]|uniref:Uncharacterized protein n=1 Tax=Rhodopirellula bahusiensis TaxID=2014065 RepID=A0A2G1W5P6_9BACT|nr:hypothetical protein CEE69_15175 [Rhodopirellula bahusiensis]
MSGNVSETRVADETTGGQTNLESDVQPGEKQDRVEVRKHVENKIPNGATTGTNDRSGGLPIDFHPSKEVGYPLADSLNRARKPGGIPAVSERPNADV